MAIFEIRDSNGLTVYLTWQSDAMSAAGGQANISASWIADGIGVYEIRTFSLSNFTNPIILDVVKSRSIPVAAEEETGA